MRKKKTIKVSTIKNLVNDRLSLVNISEDKRSVLCTLIETILMNTGNYRGYLYADINDYSKASKDDNQINPLYTYIKEEYKRKYI